MSNLCYREEILSMKSPFCITDLFKMFNSNTTNARNLVIQELNYLYDTGLVEYKKNMIGSQRVWSFNVI